MALLGAGVAEVLVRRGCAGPGAAGVHAWPLIPLGVAIAAGTGGLGALAWVAFKVGALSYGGGFVIVPLMQRDAVETYEWMTGAEFLNAVALGQVTPGPVTHTIAVVGYAAAGVGGALLATAVAFAPSSCSCCSGRGTSSRSARTRPPRPSWAAPARPRSARSSASPFPLRWS